MIRTRPIQRWHFAARKETNRKSLFSRMSTHTCNANLQPDNVPMATTPLATGPERKPWPTGRKSAMGTTRGQLKATKMLLVVSTVFLLCHFPKHAVKTYDVIMQMADTDNYKASLHVEIWKHFVLVLYYCGFSCNFFLYSLSSRTFRHGLKRLWVKMKKRLHFCGDKSKNEQEKIVPTGTFVAADILEPTERHESQF